MTYRTFLLITLLALSCVYCDRSNGAIALRLGSAQSNRGADTYDFQAFVQNTGSANATVESFNLPFDLGADGIFFNSTDLGFSFDRFSVAGTDSEGDFSSTSNVASNNPFYDLLVGATATGADTGLQLAPGEEKLLFHLSFQSDGSAIGDATAGSLITAGTGANFGQFFVDGSDIFGTSEFVAPSSGFSLTTTSVPEPSSAILIFALIASATSRRRRTSPIGEVRLSYGVLS